MKMAIIKSLVVDPSGAVYLNKLRPYVKGNILTPSAANYPLSVAAMSGINPGKSAPIAIESPQDGTSEILALTGAQGSAVDSDVARRFSVIITDAAIFWRLTYSALHKSPDT
jgi:hypothetical protein